MSNTSEYKLKVMQFALKKHLGAEELASKLKSRMEFTGNIEIDLANIIYFLDLIEKEKPSSYL